MNLPFRVFDADGNLVGATYYAEEDHAGNSYDFAAGVMLSRIQQPSEGTR